MRPAVAAVVILAWSCSPVPAPPSEPSPPSSGLYTLTGTVFDRTDQGLVPIRSRVLFHHVQPGDTFSTTDEFATENGQFRFEHIPSGTRVKIRALATIGDWRNQPCAVNATIAGDTVRDVELVRNGATGLTTGSPTLRGTVYEQTPAGPRPIPNADVSFVSGCTGLHEVYMRTDADGRYAFCRVPAGSGCVFALVERFGERWFPERRIPVSIGNDTILDVQLTEGTPPELTAFGALLNPRRR